jgi:hypothetical protein
MAGPVTGTPSLEDRVAALEEMLAHPPRFILPPVPGLTPGQEAGLRECVTEATLKAGPFGYRVILQPPPLTPDEVRQLLRECVTVVRPGETLVIRGRNWTPLQVREIQQVMDAMHEDGRIPFRVLAVFGDELGVVQPPAPDLQVDLGKIASYAYVGDAVKDGCQHIMTGGCPLDCFRGPCMFEQAP